MSIRPPASGLAAVVAPMTGRAAQRLSVLRRFVVAGCLVVVSSVVGASPASAALATDWTTVSAGREHTCAIRSVGKLYCWGDDFDGQVGNGATIGDVISPKQITLATDWKSVSAGYSHTCAIRSVGKLYCWGNDGGGQVGNGATIGDVISPKQITSATDWKAVDTGDGHTCAIRSVGKLYCWGGDGNGQLGNGAGSDSTIPIQITSATDWKTVSGGNGHTCAIRSVGKLYCWGYNGDGEVGNGAATGDVTAPVQVTSATDWKTVSAGDAHTCAVRGKLYCWGDDTYEQIGNGATTGDVLSPKQITSATDWKTVSAGLGHTCAVRGKLYCWGYDTYEQVGNGDATNDNVISPKQITSATDWKTVSAAETHTCAVRGKLYCWGSEGNGQLGNGAPTDNVTSPQQE